MLEAAFNVRLSIYKSARVSWGGIKNGAPVTPPGAGSQGCQTTKCEVSIINRSGDVTGSGMRP
jgi:hypothetical protein